MIFLENMLKIETKTTFEILEEVEWLRAENELLKKLKALQRK